MRFFACKPPTSIFPSCRRTISPAMASIRTRTAPIAGSSTPTFTFSRPSICRCRKSRSCGRTSPARRCSSTARKAGPRTRRKTAAPGISRMHGSSWWRTRAIGSTTTRRSFSSRRWSRFWKGRSFWKARNIYASARRVAKSPGSTDLRARPRRRFCHAGERRGRTACGSRRPAVAARAHRDRRDAPRYPSPARSTLLLVGHIRDRPGQDFGLMGRQAEIVAIDLGSDQLCLVLGGVARGFRCDLHPAVGNIAQRREGEAQAVAGVHHQATGVVRGLGGLTHVLEREALDQRREPAHLEVVGAAVL